MILSSTTYTHPFHLFGRISANNVPLLLPLSPNTALAQVATTTQALKVEPQERDTEADVSSAQGGVNAPVRLIIPSIKLDSQIVGVGRNTKGEMDVPSGKTKNVGWYKDGTIPGELGSAVLDAHVFAAFNHLNELKEGADVYVLERGGGKLHFQVSYRKIYALHDVPLNKLFLAADARRLNLITCAGSLTRDYSTYDHRLIVYTTLIEDAGE